MIRQKSERVQRIKRAILTKPYIFYFIFIFFIYLSINILLNQIYVTIPLLKNYNPIFLYPYVLFNFLIIPFLVALTINLTIMKFKDLKSLKGKENSAGLLGIFSGVIGGACPGCFAGLFPAFIGLFGVNATLSSLPLFGIEIQIFSAILLIVAIVLLTRPTICKVQIAI